MSEYSIKKIQEQLETIVNNQQDTSKRLIRIENAVLGDEDGDFIGHKQRLGTVERSITDLVEKHQYQNKRIDRVYWTAGIVLTIITILAATL